MYIDFGQWLGVLAIFAVVCFFAKLGVGDTTPKDHEPWKAL